MSDVQPVLRADRLGEIFKACLFQDGEDTSRHVLAEGILTTAGFHPERIEVYREEIRAMLGELPGDFQPQGGGASFLGACMDRYGRQWANIHATVEQLLMLGLALEMVEYCAPREQWLSLYGGMPYFVIKQ